MYDDILDPIGAVWLIKKLGVEPVFPLYVTSGIGGRREIYKDGNLCHNLYQDTIRPADNVIAHIQFHLRHEIVHLELLFRVFDKVGSDEVQKWVTQEPTGQYARRTAFLYEWLTGKDLEVPKNLGGNYVDAIDAKTLITASPEHRIKNQRWRINDNLAGTPDFCPMLVKTDSFIEASNLNIGEMVEHLSNQFGTDLLMRASVWMTLRESKASFAIEGEGRDIKRIERFADVMARRTGKGDIALEPDSLAALQRDILGDSAAISQFGIRQSPVFVGQTHIRGLREVVHYIAPPFEEVADKLQGLKTFIDRTSGQSSIVRSAVASFAFIYIHPLADGNGRVHRFLINDVLRRDNVIQEPIILPISQAIAEHPSDRQAYNRILESVSAPLITSIREHYNFSKEATTYSDGIRSNLQFNDVSFAQPIWRFMDLTPHVQYLSQLIQQVIEKDMLEESRYLKQHDIAREAIKDIIEMPNDYADRIIRSIEQNKGIKSNKILKDFPFLTDKVWEKMVTVVADIFDAT